MSETRDIDPVPFGGRKLPRVIANALRFCARAAAPALEAQFTPVPMVYTNHRQSTRRREIVPVSLQFGSQWHPGEHVLYALDAETGMYREFALSGIRAFGQGAVDERTEQLVAMGRAMSAIAILADREPDAMTAFEILADAGAVPCAASGEEAASC